MKKIYFLLLLCLSIPTRDIIAQHSIAREWNEFLLEAIRDDFARPTVHARNLFHSSIAMYDAWAIFDVNAETYLLGKTVNNFPLDFTEIETPSNVQQARHEVISYAMARLLRHRFRLSASATKTVRACDSLLAALGYDPRYSDTDYSGGNWAGLGNYIGQGLIDYGLQDGSTEAFDYRNLYYRPLNFPLDPRRPGNRFIEDPNRWQPLTFELFIDQSGNPIAGDTPPFLSPEWGIVYPFALNRTDLTVYENFGTDFFVYHDPGAPPTIPLTGTLNGITEYQKGFAMVALWASHLDPSDSVMWDISPAAQGNFPSTSFPTTIDDLLSFYKELEGGDISQGHAMNPATGLPYEPNIVPRGDFTRVLAEFWADGPDSETPPGHWFTILNYVNDHPMLQKKFQGEGEELDELEWDVKSYFMLGGAMHDAAVTAWGIKGHYDYVRPISALRWMADQGQCSDPNLPNYDPRGIPLQPGFIELVTEDDPVSLTGVQNQLVGQVKIRSWRGPSFIDDPDTTVAGVGWILASNWWPYQRPSFVTPNFAGYVSGHSTYSRAAAEVLTLLTGDPFFPGGMGEFVARKNEFLVFEDGPSQDVVLQWATYRDASNQTSLSRIWGGIHPPVDDIPGRLIGEKIGIDAFEKAAKYFSGDTNLAFLNPDSYAYPNPVQSGGLLYIAIKEDVPNIQVELLSLDGRRVQFIDQVVPGKNVYLELDLRGVNPGMYVLRMKADGIDKAEKIQVY